MLQEITYNHENSWSSRKRGQAGNVSREKIKIRRVPRFYHPVQVWTRRFGLGVVEVFGGGKNRLPWVTILMDPLNKAIIPRLKIERVGRGWIPRDKRSNDLDSGKKKMQRGRKSILVGGEDAPRPKEISKKGPKRKLRC